ncbi:MAG: hypothetical protein K2F74_00185, partial [Muribaculaceae bacterium]|nr:hypothetical protein [Muribaculaceae bacterium]
AAPASLRLKLRGNLVGGLDASIAILQVECRRKYAAKFAEPLASDPEFYFPGGINAEQATGDRLAAWHASLINEGDRIADLTAGLGIDIMHLARRAKSALAVERQLEVADALTFNATNSGIHNLRVVCADCRELLDGMQADEFDCLFIDPARRAEDGSRVFALSDCQPDITDMQAKMLNVSPKYIAKLSPMLDISHLLGQLPQASHIIALGTTTECKELLAVVNRNHTGDAVVEAVTILPDNSERRISFNPAEERAADITYGMPQIGDILFEPWPAVMKAAPVKLLTSRYGIRKIAANTHLYFIEKDSGQSADGLPGNCLEISAVIPYSSSEIKRFARRWPIASVSTRNFGIGADAL